MQKFCLLILIPLFLSCADDVWYMWEKERRKGNIVAIVNDSLALRNTYRCFTSQTNWILENEEYDCSSNLGLQLVNYRKEQPSLWNDTLNDYFEILGQLSDSVVYGGAFELHGKIKFWEIGFKPYTKEIVSWQELCDSSLKIGKMRTWKDGKFLLLNKGKTPVEEAHCQYGILDTATGNVELKRFTEELSWLADCDDINYLADQPICLKKNAELDCAIDLLANGKLKSTLVVESCEPDFGWYSGSYVWIRIKGSNKLQIHKILPSPVFDSFYPETSL